MTARNEALDGTPELVNSDPYGEGWLFELEPSDAGQLGGLLDAAAYRHPPAEPVPGRTERAIPFLRKPSHLIVRKPHLDYLLRVRNSA